MFVKELCEGLSSHVAANKVGGGGASFTLDFESTQFQVLILAKVSGAFNLNPCFF